MSVLMAKLRTRGGRKFLLSVALAFIIMVAVVTRATIGGVIEQYDIPLPAWTPSMYAIQFAMIGIYSLVFTILLAVPLGICFLNGEEKKPGKE